MGILLACGKPSIELLRGTCVELTFRTTAQGAIVASGEYVESVPYLLNPGNSELLVKIGMFAVMSALGQNFIFMTLENFNALILTTVTTTRKCFTVAISVVYYGHKLTSLQYLGISLVVAGLALELYGKYTKSQTSKSDQERKAK